MFGELESGTHVDFFEGGNEEHGIRVSDLELEIGSRRRLI
jgi:hypothetical protein